jgi:putative ABC transport system permease protein
MLPFEADDQRIYPMIVELADFRIAYRNLLRNRRRTAVALLTVAGGCITYLLAGGFIDWIFVQMREATIHSQLGHLQIVRPGYFDKGIADPYAYLLPEDRDLQKTLTQTIKPIVITPRLSFSGLISFHETTISFLGEGVDPAGEAQVSTRINVFEGQNFSSEDDRSVILGEGLAANLGVTIGQTVVLLATSASGSPNAVEAKVSGIFVTTSKEFDDHALRMPISVVRKLMRVTGATSWIVLLDKTEKTPTAKLAAMTTLPKSEFEVVPWSDLADFYNKTVVLFSKQVNVVKTIIALIIILSISNTQTMSVLERTTEIGTSLAIGIRRNQVLRLFLLEGLLIGIIGGIIGISLGYILGEGISKIGIPMPPAPGMAHGYTGEILVTPYLAIDALFLAILTTLIASVMPAWRASRMIIVDALRCNQ